MNLLLPTTASAAILISLLAVPTKVEIAKSAVGTEATAYVQQLQRPIAPQGASSSVADVVAGILRREGIDVEKGKRVVFCESSFRENVVGDNGDSLGLWQIRLNPTRV